MTDPSLRIVPVTGLDPADDDRFRQWAEVYEVSGRHAFGHGHSSWSVEELRELERSTDRRRLGFAAVVPSGAVVGAVGVLLPLHDNPALAQVVLAVHPDHRRRGIGSALLSHAEGAAAAEGRSVLVGETQWPTGAADEFGEGFAVRHGYAAAQTVLRSDLAVPADRVVLERLAAGDGTGDYAVTTCWDGIPEQWLDGRAELGRRMSTDVPLGDLELQEEHWDAARVRALYARIAAMGRRVADTYAVERGTGALVAFTQVQVGAPPHLGWQQDTLVVREHRGHGLGRRVKAANTLALMDELPGLRSIRTWNAEENAPMLAVNRELGYLVDAFLREWQKVV